jgi:hypothetical protein
VRSGYQTTHHRPRQISSAASRRGWGDRRIPVRLPDGLEAVRGQNGHKKRRDALREARLRRRRRRDDRQPDPGFRQPRACRRKAAFLAAGGLPDRVPGFRYMVDSGASLAACGVLAVSCGAGNPVAPVPTPSLNLNGRTGPDLHNATPPEPRPVSRKSRRHSIDRGAVSRPSLVSLTRRRDAGDGRHPFSTFASRLVTTRGINGRPV